MFDPVHFAQLHGIHTQFIGQFVNDAFDGKCGFGATGTANGIGGCLVSENPDAIEVIRLHLVDSGEHEHAEERNAWRNDL